MESFIKSLKQAKETYEYKRFEIAKFAYYEIKQAIDQWQNQDEIDIEFFWDGVVEVDGHRYDAEDFEEKDEVD